MADDYGLSNELVFGTWQELFQASAMAIETNGARIADAVLVTVQDSLHKEVVLAFAEQGYHILCEKPMATSLADCVQITEAVKKANVIFGMGHGQSQTLVCLAFMD
jgi:predicted dehydrogenase